MIRLTQAVVEHFAVPHDRGRHQHHERRGESATPLLRIRGARPALKAAIADLAELPAELLESGALQGARDIVARLLRTRFGELDVAVESRIAKATTAELGRWTERAAVAERIEVVFKE